MRKDKYSRPLTAGDIVDYTQAKSIHRGVIIGFTAKRIKIIPLKFIENLDCFVPERPTSSAATIDRVDVVKI